MGFSPNRNHFNLLIFDLQGCLKISAPGVKNTWRDQGGGRGATLSGDFEFQAAYINCLVC